MARNLSCHPEFISGSWI